MRAIVIKNHYEPTASLAYIVRKEVPGIEVFGGVVLTAARVFAIDPLRGIWPSGNMLPPLAVGFAANAMWGWGTLVFLRAFMSDDAGED